MADTISHEMHMYLWSAQSLAELVAQGPKAPDYAERVKGLTAAVARRLAKLSPAERAEIQAL